MHILEQNDTQLVLAGIPGGRFWMIVLAGIGLLLTGAIGAFAVAMYHQEGGLAWPHFPLSIGILIGQGLFWTGCITLVIGRQRLILDKAAGTGTYQVRSPIVDVGKPCSFKLAHVKDITLETRTETRPGRPGHAEGEATVHQVRLRLNKPRRAIVLDETEHGKLDRLNALAGRVAEFLGQAPTLLSEETG